MLTKEELVNTYIKYSSDITEEIWDKLVIKFKELGFYLWQNKGYKRYKEGSIIFINEKGDNSYWVTDGYFTPNADKKEIQVLDILGEEPQFEVGRWYRSKSWATLYLNPSKDEVIWSSGKFEKSYESNENINDWLLLTDLSEIQQYLPDNHPDKLPKTIEKWSIGSYVVALENYTLSKNILKGDMRRVNAPDSNNNKMFGELIVNSWQEDIILPKWKWFATLSEAEAFSKSLLESEESKTLTINDLVEGEIYYCLNNTICKWGKKDSIYSINSDEEFWSEPGRYSGENNFRPATPKEKKWLLTCIKQDKFIPQDQLGMYDSEGNLIEDKPKFKIGDYVITNRYSSLYNGRILRITKFSDRYPDIAYFEVFDDGYYSKNDNFSLDKVERFATPEEIAKVTKPEPKESKEFDRNWYIEVSSQEEADKVFEYLKSIGESVVSNEFSNRKYIPKRDYKYIYYLTDAEQWFLGTNPRNYPQKQLSDILPNYSKVNRNVYYEVSNQEEYEEILDWLKSMGEEVNRNYKVVCDWKYVYFIKDSDCWELGGVKPDLPKAEFPFKGRSKKQSKIGDVRGSSIGMWEQMKPENIFPVENFEIRLTELKQEPRVKLINVPRI